MTFLQLQSKLFHCSWVGMNLFFPGGLYLATNIYHLPPNIYHLRQKFTLELQKSHSKIDSTTTPNPLHMKIMQITQKLSKEYWDIKRNNFIPKVTWSIVRECPPYSLSKRKCYLCLNEKLEINSYKGKQPTEQKIGVNQ